MGLFKKPAPPAYTPPKTVASITAGLSDTVADLETLAAGEAQSASLRREVAAQALAAADAHDAESALATKVAGNIRALLN